MAQIILTAPDDKVAIIKAALEYKTGESQIKAALIKMVIQAVAEYQVEQQRQAIVYTEDMSLIS